MEEINIENKENEKEKILDFLSSMSVIGIATNNEKNKQWLSNFYYLVDENFKIYYFTVKESLHTKNILKNNEVAFSVFWHSKETFLDRKSIQGVGSVRRASGEEKKTALSLAAGRFSEIEKKVSEKVFLGQDSEIYFWILEPTFIKYLDDEKYGELESINLNIFYDEK